MQYFPIAQIEELVEAITSDHCQQTDTEFRKDVFNHTMKMRGVTPFDRMFDYISAIKYCGTGFDYSVRLFCLRH